MKLKFITLFLFSTSALFNVGWAGVLADSTFDASVSPVDESTYVRYIGEADFSADSLQTVFSQAFHIGAVATGMVYLSPADVTGDELVEVAIEFSQDRQVWYGAQVILDTLNQPAFDTLSTHEGVKAIAFSHSPWARLRFTGLAGNSKTTVKWYATLPKKPGAGLTAKALNKR